MRLKSYFAGTVESAICLARQELGEEAMLVSSRKALPEARHLGIYEVVFAAAQEPAVEAAAARAGPKLEETPAPHALAAEMAEMRRQLERISALVCRSSTRGRRKASTPNPAIDDIEEILAAHEVEATLACEILQNLEGLASPSEVRQAFRKDLQERLRVSPELSPWTFEAATGPPATGRTVVALVGPPGVGKTTMLAKLAVRYGLGSIDLPWMPNLSYAAILGVGFEALETVGGLAQSLKENSRKELILIDTPGYSAADFDLSCDLTQFLSTYPHVDIHLVLSCSAKSSDISRMVERYSDFGPAKLVFTRLDETSSYGAILNESIRTGLPVSFLGAGPRVPDDLEPAAKDRIIGLLLEGRESRAVATA